MTRSTSPNRKIYRRFAQVYDEMGADRHSLKMSEYTFVIVHRFNVEVNNVLDLCCGTGSAMKMFSELGWAVVGVDASAAMLEMAEEKLKGRRALLYNQTLPKIKIPFPTDQGFDLVTSFYDSLNYLLRKSDLKGAFRAAYKHLRPGGLFVFDMNTEEALKIIWDGHVYADARDDLAWIWKNVYDEKKKTADCIADFFVKTGKNWERFTEVHTERAYKNSEIRAMLREVGFTVKGIYHCGTMEPATTKTYRIAVVAQRPYRS